MVIAVFSVTVAKSSQAQAKILTWNNDTKAKDKTENPYPFELN